MAKVDFCKSSWLFEDFYIFPTEFPNILCMVLKVIDFGHWQDYPKVTGAMAGKGGGKGDFGGGTGSQKPGKSEHRSLDSTIRFSKGTVLKVQFPFVQFLQCFRSMLNKQVFGLFFFPEFYFFHLLPLHGPKS